MTMIGRVPRFLTGLALGLALCLAGIARADDQPVKPGAQANDGEEHHSGKPGKDKTGSALLDLLPADSTTQHTLQLGGQKLAYSATAGTLTLRDDKGESSARIFYVSYVMQGGDPKTRPVSFYFNGGPGAGMAYLHLGAAGPVTLELATPETDGGHAKLADNPDSWLPFTDMVFIDPVGTGYSRAAKPEEAQKDFWGVKQDAASIAKAISLWLGRNGRMASPKFLIGESYGGVRSIKLARDLQREESVIVNGIVMVSPLIEGALLNDSENDILGHALHLPSFVAAALERRHAFDPQAVEEAYKYALGDYLTTLAGPLPDGDAGKAFYGKIATMTDIPVETVARHAGRLPWTASDIRRRDGELRSVYDYTLGIADPYPGGDGRLVDPVLVGYGRAYGAAFSGYVADTLGFKTELTYELLSEEVNARWDRYNDGGAPTSAVGDLRELLALNPSLHVLIAHGYFDVLTAFGVSRWLIDHLHAGRDRVELKLFPGGHMLYTRPGSRAGLKEAAASLIAAAK
ncbi:MAG TPA: peptidase S10 [Aliidongia sp.]|nr:peptidase S10 [Aliidongia sp.]